MKALMLRLEAPIMSFGTVAVHDTIKTATVPGQAMIAGLLANALGLRRADAAAIQEIQDSIVIASRLDRSGTRLWDFQTAQLAKGDLMWSSTGTPIGRSGGPNTYDSPAILKKEFISDASVTVAVQSSPEVVDHLAAAMLGPARPLFIGRKAFVPSRPIFDDVVDAETVLDAIRRHPLADDADGDPDGFISQWPCGIADGFAGQHTVEQVCDLKDWRNNVHMASRTVVNGRIVVEKAK